MEILFSQPQYLWILLAIPLLIILHLLTLKYTKGAALKIANYEALERVAKGQFLGTPYKGKLTNKSIILLLIRSVVYALMIFSISGATLWYVADSSQFDFVLAVDTSASMLVEDFVPNRLEAAKDASKKFVEAVPDKTDIGILTFAGSTMTNLLPTDDKVVVLEAIERISINEFGGTNIGDTIMSATTILISSEGEEQDAVVVLTDGRSNVGTAVDKAIEYAKSNNVVVYTIGVGTEEGGSFLLNTTVSTIDEESLKSIAEMTGGKYYRAESEGMLNDAFTELAKAKEKKFSFDLSWILLVIALVILSVEWLLINTKYKTIS